MSLAPLAGLAECAAAAVALLFAIAAYVLLQAIGRALPHISVGPVSFNPGGWFISLGEDVAHWIVTLARDQWAFMRDLFNITAWLFDHAFNATADAISHAFDYADHIVTSTIPGAIGDLRRDVQGYIAAAIGAAAHAISTGADDIGRAVAHVVAGGVTEAEHYADHAISALHDAVRHEIADAVSTVEGDIHDLKVQLTRSISDLSDTVAADYHSALAAAQADATAALNTARGLIQDAKTEAENIAAADLAKVQGLLQSAINTTNATVDKLTGTVAADFTQAEQYAQAQVAAGVKTVTDELDSTAKALSSSIATAAAAAQAGIAGAVQAAQADANAALGKAEGVIEGALGGIYTDLTGKAIALNGDLSAIEGLLAGAITGAIAGVVARVAHLEKCSVGVCEDSPNNFGNLLHDALGLASMAGVGVFLAELIHDPKAAEQKYADVVGGLFNTGQSALDTLLSL